MTDRAPTGPAGRGPVRAGGAARAAPPAAQPGRGGWPRRAAFVGAGALLVTSAVNAGGTDLRPGRYDCLADLAEQESRPGAGAAGRGGRRSTPRSSSSAPGSTTTGSSELQAGVDALAGPAGLTAVRRPGPHGHPRRRARGVRATRPATRSADAIVHQQDIQAVVNALWAGGAEAMTIQGQRVVSTTGIKCVGNTVHPARRPLLPAVRRPRDRRRRRDAAQPRRAAATSRPTSRRSRPTSSAGRSRERGGSTAPAYDGPMELRHARGAADRRRAAAAASSATVPTARGSVAVGRPRRRAGVPVARCGVGVSVGWRVVRRRRLVGRRVRRRRGGLLVVRDRRSSPSTPRRPRSAPCGSWDRTVPGSAGGRRRPPRRRPRSRRPSRRASASSSVSPTTLGTSTGPVDRYDRHRRARRAPTPRPPGRSRGPASFGSSESAVRNSTSSPASLELLLRPPPRARR